MNRSLARRSFLSVGVLFVALLMLLTLPGRFAAVQAGPDGDKLYVDGASGVDSGNCREAQSPCKSITYALNRAAGGATILVAQGTYLENLQVNKSVILEGGYEAADWTRDIASNETIIDGTNGQYQIGDWDGRTVGRPAVIKDGSQFRIWYDGQDIVGRTRQIGTASSSDGKNWTKYSQNPVLSGDAGAWDEFNQHKPFVIKENGTYKMWYQGTQGDSSNLGYATSSDGLDWQKYSGNPVLQAGPETYDRLMAGSGSILFESGIYRLWYYARGDLGNIVAYATSPDGISWTKMGTALLRSASGWDSASIVGPSVLKFQGKYWMWYEGLDGNNNCAIGAVTSPDGVTWTRFRNTPVLSDPSTNCTGNARVIEDGGKLKMWYETYSGDPWRGYINYAESDDGINWTRFAGNPVLSPGDLGTFGQSVVRFSSDSDDSVLEGFTITNGFAQWGGGVDLWQTSVTLRDNLITQNEAVDFGGGAAAAGGSFLLAEDNVFNGNSVHMSGGGGISIYSDSWATISENKIYENISGGSGGAINSYGHNGPLLIIKNDIHDNEAAYGGGGIIVGEGDYQVNIAANNIYRNQALWGSGGGINIYNVAAEVSIKQNDIYGNSANSGGGLALGGKESLEFVVDSNNIRDNHVQQSWSSGGVDFDNILGAALVQNNVIASNDNSGIRVVNYDTIKVTNNTIVANGERGFQAGSWPDPPTGPIVATLTNNIITRHKECAVDAWNGALIAADFNDLWDNAEQAHCEKFNGTNISLNPRFLDGSGGDYRLRPNSPAIDAGTAIGAPLFDLNGLTRPFGGSFDMGAYEWPNYRLALPLIMGAN